MSSEDDNTFNGPPDEMCADGKIIAMFKQDKYRKALSQLAINGSTSLLVDFQDIFAADSEVAEKIVNEPEIHMERYIANPAWHQLSIENMEYANTINQVIIRVHNLLNTEQLRKIGSDHLNKLVMIEAIVIRAAPIKPLVTKAAFKCKKCDRPIYINQPPGPFIIGPKKCEDCGASGQYMFEFQQDKTEFVDSQDLKVQERPEDLPAGQLPRTLNVKIIGKDLVDIARPGDHINIVGIVRAFTSKKPGAGKMRAFTLQLEANSLDVLGKEPDVVATVEDEENILKLSQDKWVHRKIINSIAPSIYGYEHVKEAITYLLFGGVTKNLPDMTIRGETNILMVGDPGIAKALDINTPIPTPDGWKTMGELQPQDAVFDEQGKICYVVTTSPIMYNHDVYRVEFDDGSIINADAGHLWKTSTRASRVSKHRCRKRDKTRIHDGRTQTDKQVTDATRTTLQIKNTLFRIDKRGTEKKRKNHAISVAAPLNLPEIKLPIPPYVLGAWLGDGNSADGGITCSENEILDEIRKAGYQIRRRPSGKYKYGILGLHKQLRENNLFGNKHIPKKYLRASFAQRLKLLQGLMDTDGTQPPNSASSFCSANKKLFDQVTELLCSLGIKVHLMDGDARINGKDCGKFYKAHFNTTLPIFKLQRKRKCMHAKNWRSSPRFNRYIAKVTKIKSKPVRCIMVDSPSNLFLAGKPMIPTHNSQLLLYVAKVAPRGLYTSGRGTSAAGLTAAVMKEKGGGMSLEAGAMVLADKGVLCIDEMDKMRPEDRVAIHEAMEQHTVSVAKGGIVSTLNARTATLAAANPALGRYEPHRTLAENIGGLPVTLLSRFDLIFVLRDIPNPESDGKLSEHILNLHKDRKAPIEPPVNPDLLRKYIAYSKQYQPVFTQGAIDKLKEFYLEMRKASESEESPIAITARQLEALIRLAEARARVALQKEVTVLDAEAAISLMQKSLQEVGIDVSNYRVDIDLIMTGKPKSLRDKISIVLKTLLEMEKEVSMVEEEALLIELESKHKINRPEAKRILETLKRDGTIHEPREGYIRKT